MNHCWAPLDPRPMPQKGSPTQFQGWSALGSEKRVLDTTNICAWQHWVPVRKR